MPTHRGATAVQITNHDLQTIKTIARMAASVCQTIQEEMVHPAQKDGREPVTIADYASQALIGNALASNYPDDAVLSEERSEEFMLLLDDAQRALVQRYVTDAVGGYVFEEEICAWLDYGKQKTAERTWVIDPIDGTKGFRRGGITALDGCWSFRRSGRRPRRFPHEDPRANTSVCRSRATGQRTSSRCLRAGADPRLVVLSLPAPCCHQLRPAHRPCLLRDGKALGRGPDSSARRQPGQHAMIAAGWAISSSASRRITGI